MGVINKCAHIEANIHVGLIYTDVAKRGPVQAGCRVTIMKKLVDIIATLSKNLEPLPCY